MCISYKKIVIDYKMVRYDDVGSLGKKLKMFFYKMDISTLLIMLIGIGILALLMGSINESLITAQTTLTFVITSIMMYLYIKKQYSKKIKVLKNKNKILKKNSILDDLCASKKHNNSKLCNKYNSSKRDFYTITNMLLQRYNISE